MANNSYNLSNITTGHEDSQAIPALWVKSWTATYLLLCLEGAAGNALIVFLILSNSRFRTGCGLLIAHCLIAYTVLCSISFPVVTISVYEKQINGWQINPRHCKIPQMIQITCRIAAMWLDACIAINRFLALCFPHQYRELTRKKRERIVLIFCWTLGGLIGILGCFDIGMVYVMMSLGTCAAFPRGKGGMVVTVVGYYGPAALAGFTYVLVYIHAACRKRTQVAVQGTSRSEQKSASEGASKVDKKRMMTTNMMCVSYLCNALFCQMLPIVANFTRSADDLSQPLLIMWMAIAQLLGYTTNPPVCFIINKGYREEVRRITKNIVSRMKNGHTAAWTGSVDVEMTSVRERQRRSS